MSVRIDLDVTLAHKDAKSIAEILHDFARGRYNHAKKTNSQTVREICISSARDADRLAELVVSSLYRWDEEA